MCVRESVFHSFFLFSSLAILAAVLCAVRLLPMSCVPNWALILASSARLRAKVMVVLTFVGLWEVQSQWLV